MASKNESIEDLKLMVQASLENTGVLPRLRAELRKHVFVAIEGASEGTTYNEKLRGIQANAVDKSALDLVKEFLYFYELDYTSSVLEAEASVPRAQNSSLAAELGVKLQSSAKPKPILVSLLEMFFSGASSEKAGAVAKSMDDFTPTDTGSPSATSGDRSDTSPNPSRSSKPQSSQHTSDSETTGSGSVTQSPSQPTTPPKVSVPDEKPPKSSEATGKQSSEASEANAPEEVTEEVYSDVEEVVEEDVESYANSFEIDLDESAAAKDVPSHSSSAAREESSSASSTNKKSSPEKVLKPQGKPSSLAKLGSLAPLGSIGSKLGSLAPLPSLDPSSTLRSAPETKTGSPKKKKKKKSPKNKRSPKRSDVSAVSNDSYGEDSMLSNDSISEVSFGDMGDGSGSFDAMFETTKSKKKKSPKSSPRSQKRAAEQQKEKAKREEKEAKEKADKEAREKADKEAKEKADKEAKEKADKKAQENSKAKSKAEDMAFLEDDDDDYGDSFGSVDEDLELSFGDDSVEGAEDAIAAAFDGDDEVIGEARKTKTKDKQASDSGAFSADASPGASFDKEFDYVESVEI